MIFETSYNNMKSFLKRNAIYVPFLFLPLITFVRCFFGIETTDEALYYSEAILLNQGAVQYVDLWQQAAGAYSLYGWLIALFHLFSAEYEGLFLYMRLMFWGMRIIVTIIIYVLFVSKMRESFEKKILIVTLYPVIVLWWGQWIGFGYNSLPQIMMTLSSVVVLSEILANKEENANGLKLYVAGILMALSAYCHVTYIFSCIAMIGLIYAFVPLEKRMKKCFQYMSGGLITLIGVIILLIIKAGSISYFINGISLFLNNLTYTKHEYIGIWAQIEEMLSNTNIVFKWIFAGIIIITVIWRMFSREQGFPWKEIILKGTVVGFAALIMYYNLHDLGKQESVYYYGNYILFIWGLEVLALICWIIGKKYKKLNCIYLVVFIPELVVYLAQMKMIFSGTRPYLLLPSGLMVIPYFWCFTKDMISNWKIQKVIYVATVIGVLTVVLTINMYVYRDQDLFQLRTKMNNTVYKGLYTTQENAEAISELYRYINDFTTNEDYIFCNEFNSCVYLLSNAKYCTFSTGGGNYEYGNYDDDIMMNYMKFTKKEPSAIVYASTWVKPNISYDNPEYELNDYIKENFYCVLDTTINEAINRVLILKHK